MGSLRRAARCMAVCFLVLCLCLPNTAVDTSMNDPSTGPGSLIDWMLLQRVVYRAGNLYNGVQKVLNAEWLPMKCPFPSINKEELSDTLKTLRADNDEANALVTWLLPKPILRRMSRFMVAWFRTWILNLAFYFGAGAVWCYYAYYCFGDSLFSDGKMPPIRDMVEQMKVATSALHWYALKDAITTHLVENGYSKTYARLDEVDLGTYFGYFVAYMIFAEFWVYWAHRLVHDVPWLYKNIHQTHHSYNKADSLSPFAGIAHHPIDGILQVAPYSVGLFIFPIHYLTHLMCLVNALLWTHNLHDCIDAGIAPVLGAGFHTVHHTTYVDNYGQFFIYFDWLFGTLTAPEDLIESDKTKEEETPTEELAKSAQKKCKKEKRHLLRKLSSEKRRLSKRARSLKWKKS